MSTSHLSRSQLAALAELADDLDSIVAVVSSRDGDATARQHQRAEAVRAALLVVGDAPQCEWRQLPMSEAVQPDCQGDNTDAAMLPEDIARWKVCPYCALPLVLRPAEES